MSQSSLPDPLDNALANDAVVEGTDAPIESWGGATLRYGFPSRLMALRKLTTPTDGFYITVTDVLNETSLKVGHWVHIVPESVDLYDSIGSLEPEEAISPSDLSDDEMLLCHRVKATYHRGADEGKERESVRKITESSNRLFLPNSLLEDAFGLDVEEYPVDNPFLFEPVFEPDAEVFGLDPIGHAAEYFRDEDPGRRRLPFSTAFAKLVGRAIDVEYHDVISLANNLARTLTPATFRVADIDQVAEPEFVAVDGEEYGVYYYPLGAMQDVVGRFFGADPMVTRGVWILHGKMGTSLVARLYSETGDAEDLPADHPLNDERVEPIVLPVPDHD